MKKAIICLLIVLSLLGCKKREISDNVLKEPIVEDKLNEPDKVFKSKVINEFNDSSNNGFDYNSTSNSLYSLESELHFENFDKIENVKIYEYDYEKKNFFLSRERSYDNRNQKTNYYWKSGLIEYTYEFDEEGRKTKSEYSSFEYPDTGKLDCYQQNSYSKGKLQQEVIFQKTDYGYIKELYSLGINLRIEERFYLENGKLIKKDYYSNTELSRSIMIEYDKLDRIVYIMDKSGIKYPPIDIDETRIEYLNNGTVQLTWYDDYNRNVKVIHQNFDDNNNWLSSETFYDGRSYHKYIREFEYTE